MPPKRKQSTKTSQLRIIGGQWRSRRLDFTPAQGLRPTTDRVRETLFNWRAVDIHGARVADLFAGSGALGLEALSRGASHCDFGDRSGAAIKQISDHLLTLKATEKATCQATEAENLIAGSAPAWDIVFVDPPFGAGLVSATCQQLAAADKLTKAALIYVETGSDEPVPEVPINWQLLKEKRAGGVISRLYETS
jgi:16S rRNA (guanine966-N2)-methyltransferase